MKKNQTEYHIVKQIYKTEISKVYLATKDNTKLSYSLTQIDLSKLTQKQINIITNQYLLHSLFNNKFVVKLYDTFQVKNIYNIITEYCEGGTLADFIVREKKKGIKFIKEDVVWRLFIQITLGLYHIHLKKIVHRNLKPSNIFLNQDLTIKITNFELSEELTKSHKFLTGFVGTPYYLAPEIYEEKPYNGKIDTWALGVILYELCTFNKPFSDTSAEELRNKIIKGEFKPITNAYSKEMKSMIELLLMKDELRRPTIKEIIKTYVFVSKSKTANLYDFVLKICPWITKMKGGKFPDSHKKNTLKNSINNKSIQSNVDTLPKEINKEKIEHLIQNSRLKCTQFFNELKNVTLDTNFIKVSNENQEEIKDNDILIHKMLDQSENNITEDLKFVTNNLEGTKTFVPVVEDKKDNELDFQVKDVEDFPTQENEIESYHSNLLDELNEKIIFISKEIIKDVGELKFIEIVAKINEKSIDLDNNEDIPKELSIKFKNYVHYQNEIEKIENDLKKMI